MRQFAVLLTVAVAPMLVGAASADSPASGSSVFRVVVEDSVGADGLGTFTVLTGPGHPAGDGHPVLFTGAGNDDAGSSYLTVRSYTTGTDYVQTTSGVASAHLVSSLDPYGVVEPIGGVGYRTTYTLPGSGNAPDALSIVSEIEVAGTTPADSAVLLHVTVANHGSAPVSIGVRYLLDFANGGDDGPAWREAGVQPQIVEGASGVEPGIITLAPTSSSAAPVSIAVAQSNPGSAIFASWSHAFPFAFDYTPLGRDIAGPCGLNDSAVLTYASPNKASAIILAPGDASSVSVALTIGSATSFEVDDESSCVTPVAIPSPPPASGQPTPVPQPIELPRTGSRLQAPLTAGRR